MPNYDKPVITSLRSRLLLVTALVVLVMGLLVYLPAIASFRQNFLEERIIAAQIAALSTEETFQNRLSPQLEQELLRSAGVISVIVGRADLTLILGADVMPDEANANFDLRDASLGVLMLDALDTLSFEGQRIIRITSDGSTSGSRFVEITMDEEILYDALNNFSNNILIIDVIVSLVTGILVYVALHLMMVRPMYRIKRAIIAFSENPEKVDVRLGKSVRADEIGIVERELARMQTDLRHALRQKTRLAELGEAVSKINHDLRNILATTQLASDSLARSQDPKIRKTASRLISSISRAIALCERTLKHGKAEEPAPQPQEINLGKLMLDVRDTLGISDHTNFSFTLDFDTDMIIYADEGQMHRVFLNICRNAFQAQPANGRITVKAQAGKDDMVHIRLIDAGPGIAATLLPHLFKAFQSAGKGGTGLGLSIARDIILAHGGYIGLEKTGKDGTVFLICLPRKPKE